MVKQLKAIVQNDPQAFVREGDAENLDETPVSFDRVGLHFMVYHVANIPDALSAAWALVRPGGILLTATNGANNYPEMKEYHRQVLRILQMPYEPPQGTERFSLANGAQFFPVPVNAVEEPGGLLFPTIDSYLSYYGSGFCWMGIPSESRQPVLRTQLVQTMEDVVRPNFENAGHVVLSSSSGYFWANKAPDA